MQRGFYKRLYDTFDVGTYRKGEMGATSRDQRKVAGGGGWFDTPKKSEAKAKRLTE